MSLRARAAARWAGVEGWFLGPAPLDGLAAARIAFGATLFLCYASRAPVAMDYWGPAGFGGAVFLAQLPDAPPLEQRVLPALAWLRFVPSEGVVWAAWALLLATSAAFALGWRTRLAGALALALHVSFYARNPFAYDGSWAQYLTGPLLYTVLAPSGRMWSLDARRAPAASRVAPAWPLRLLQVHTACMYVAAGLSRLDKESWLYGDMVFVALSGTTHSRLAIDWTPWLPLLRIGAWGSLVLEALAPLMLWLPRLGRLWALGLMALHLALELTTNVGFWSYVMIGCLASFALPWPRRTAR
jgi:hypothetical protein